MSDCGSPIRPAGSGSRCRTAQLGRRTRRGTECMRRLWQACAGPPGFGRLLRVLAAAISATAVAAIAAAAGSAVAGDSGARLLRVLPHYAVPGLLRHHARAASGEWRRKIGMLDLYTWPTPRQRPQGSYHARGTRCRVQRDSDRHLGRGGNSRRTSCVSAPTTRCPPWSTTTARTARRSRSSSPGRSCSIWRRSIAGCCRTTRAGAGRSCSGSCSR